MRRTDFGFLHMPRVPEACAAACQARVCCWDHVWQEGVRPAWPGWPPVVRINFLSWGLETGQKQMRPECRDSESRDHHVEARLDMCRPPFLSGSVSLIVRRRLSPCSRASFFGLICLSMCPLRVVSGLSHALFSFLFFLFLATSFALLRSHVARLNSWARTQAGS